MDSCLPRLPGAGKGLVSWILKLNWVGFLFIKDVGCSLAALHLFSPPFPWIFLLLGVYFLVLILIMNDENDGFPSKAGRTLKTDVAPAGFIQLGTCAALHHSIFLSRIVPRACEIPWHGAASPVWRAVSRCPARAGGSSSACGVTGMAMAVLSWDPCAGC